MQAGPHSSRAWVAGLGWAGLAMTLICSAQFVLQLDFSIVNVALPTIQRDLHMPAAQLQWVATGYALTFGSLLLTGGRLVAVQMRPKDAAPDADVHRPARAGVPAPVLAECQLRNC
jgi:hypothetical protein